jgi:chromosome segregation ATPase
MRTPILFLAATLLLLSTVTLAQGRRGGMQGGAAGQGMGAQGQGGGSGAMMGNSGSGMQTQQRQRIRASEQQQQKLRQCQQTMQQVRTQLREMARMSHGQQVTVQQAARWRDQLRTQMETVTRQQEELQSGLTSEQATALQSRLEDMRLDRERLQNMSDSLDLALQAEEFDSEQVRSQSKQMEKVASQISNQQKAIASDLSAD